MANNKILSPTMTTIRSATIGNLAILARRLPDSSHPTIFRNHTVYQVRKGFLATTKIKHRSDKGAAQETTGFDRHQPLRKTLCRDNRLPLKPCPDRRILGCIDCQPQVKRKSSNVAQHRVSTTTPRRVPGMKVPTFPSQWCRETVLMKQ